ncbi:MAG: triose-phosphate isomerase [Candidatus Wolfebacteria bacterium]|nr:triose-phosphate isomerase [Candidatus Wolfebacteria bacterium]
MKKLIIANWKMNPPTLKKAKELFSATTNYRLQAKNAEIVIVPPFIYLSELLKIKNSPKQSTLATGQIKLKIGAQNIFWATEGAYTGEISPKMLKDLYVDYAIIGHSERRKYAAETDEMINKKVIAALKESLKVILCVGEPLEIRKKGKKAAMDFVKNQLQKDLKGLKGKLLSNKLIIAYEPIWAIGTGISATPETALETIKYIKKLLITNYQLLTPRVLYGGSVDSKNIKGFLQHNEIDGALVGGASLNAKEFKKIVELTNKIN